MKPDTLLHSNNGTAPAEDCNMSPVGAVALYVGCSELWTTVTPDNAFLYVYNSCVSEQWMLSSDNIIIGVPVNEWHIELKAGQSVMVVPVDDDAWVVCPFFCDDHTVEILLQTDVRLLPTTPPFTDQLTGSTMEATTQFIGQPFVRWAIERRIAFEQINGGESMLSARIFPVVHDIGDIGLVLRWMLNEGHLPGGRLLWNESSKMNIAEVSQSFNPQRYQEQGSEFYRLHKPFLQRNYSQQIYHAVPNDSSDTTATL